MIDLESDDIRVTLNTLNKTVDIRSEGWDFEFDAETQEVVGKNELASYRRGERALVSAVGADAVISPVPGVSEALERELTALRLDRMKLAALRAQVRIMIARLPHDGEWSNAGGIHNTLNCERCRLEAEVAEK